MNRNSWHVEWIGGCWDGLDTERIEEDCVARGVLMAEVSGR